MVMLSTAVAAAALWLGALRQAAELRRLREELDEARRPPPPPSRSRGRSSRPMFTALYQADQTSAWTRLKAMPGGGALAVAAGFAMLALGLILWGPSETAVDTRQPPAELAALKRSLDSVSQSVAGLRDSLHLAAAEQTTAVPGKAVRATLAGRQGTGAGVIPPPSQLPPTPRLDPAVVPR
jgi:hypothetical protein